MGFAIPKTQVLRASPITLTLTLTHAFIAKVAFHFECRAKRENARARGKAARVAPARDSHDMAIL